MSMLAIVSALPVTTSTTTTIPVNEQNIDFNPHPYKPHPHPQPSTPLGPLQYPASERDPQLFHSYPGEDEPTKQVGTLTCDEPGCSELGVGVEALSDELEKGDEPYTACLDPGCDSARKDGEEHNIEEVGTMGETFLSVS